MLLGQGNTSYGKDYRFIDEQPFTGDNYYRLRQVDFNDDSDISKAIHVNLNGREGKVAVFPTNIPEGMDAIQIELPATQTETVVTITDVQGKQLLSSRFEAQEETSVQALAVDNLPKGLYFVSAWVNGGVQTVRVVK